MASAISAMTSWAPSGGDAGDLIEAFPCHEFACDALREGVLTGGADITLTTRAGCRPALPGPLPRGGQGGQ
jgi:hypothetical protein